MTLAGLFAVVELFWITATTADLPPCYDPDPMSFDLLPDEYDAFLAFCARLGYPNPDPDSEHCAALLATWRTWDQPSSESRADAGSAPAQSPAES